VFLEDQRAGKVFAGIDMVQQALDTPFSQKRGYFLSSNSSVFSRLFEKPRPITAFCDVRH